MSIVYEPTLSGGCLTLREAFEKGRELARKSDGPICFLDPSGIGVPTLYVTENAEWEEWVESPKSILDQSDRALVDVKKVMQDEDVVEALFRAAKNDTDTNV